VGGSVVAWLIKKERKIYESMCVLVGMVGGVKLLLKVQVFEEVTLCCWVSGLLLFEGLQGV